MVISLKAFNATHLVLVFVLFFLFNQQYAHFVVEHYEYMGFSSDGVDLWELLLALLLTLCSCSYLFLSQSHFQKAISTLVQVFFFLPNLIYWMHNDIPALFFTSSLVLIAILSIRELNLPKLTTTILSIREQVLALALIVALGSIALMFVYQFNFNFEVFKLSSAVYELRAENAESVPSWVMYLLSPFVKVVLPLSICYGVVNKNYLLSTLSFSMLILIFMLNPHKSILFGALVVLVFSFLRTYHLQILGFLVALTGVISVGALLAENGEFLLNSLVVRRVFFLPAYLNHCYFELFNEQNFYFSYGFMSYFIDYPYELEPAMLVGKAYFGSETVNANNGFLSDTFINLGSIGLFAAVVFVAYLFKVLDSLRISASYFGLFFLLVFNLLSTGLFTSLLTHGTLILLLMSVFFLAGTKAGNTRLLQ